MVEQRTPDENEPIFVQNIIAKRKERILSQKGLALTSHSYQKVHSLLSNPSFIISRDAKLQCIFLNNFSLYSNYAAKNNVTVLLLTFLARS
jgi:hypothetical protein